MRDIQDKIRLFMQHAIDRGQPGVIREQPTVEGVHEAEKSLRRKLIREEAFELMDAIEADDIIGIADGIADLVYVAVGAALVYGIDMEPVFNEVHRANMTKFAPGGYLNDNGKWCKPPDWTPPRIWDVLEKQSYDPLQRFKRGDGPPERPMSTTHACKNSAIKAIG